MQRRQFLATTGIAAVTTLAGCSGEEDGGNGGNGGDGGDSGSEGNESSGSSNGSESDSGNESENESGSNESNESSGSENADEVLADEDQESTVEGLEITEHELVEGDFGVSVEGVVINDTGRTLEYVEVGVVLYNADGQRIGNSFTNTTDLPDGEEWAVEVLLAEDAEDIEEYTIAVTDSPF